MSALVLYEEQDHVATLTLNRPEKRNAMSPDMLVAMRDYVRQVRLPAQHACSSFVGRGTQAFTAGYDIGRLP